MHPLHDYVAKQLSEKLKTRKVVVWYDQGRDFASFVTELRGAPSKRGELAQVKASGVSAVLAEYDGSFLELRDLVEPHFRGDSPDAIVLYVPGCERDRRGSMLMELEKAGTEWEPELKRLARDVLLQRYTQGVVDELVPYERNVTYTDLARAASETASTEPPSILKAIFHETTTSDGLLAAWLADEARDGEIQTKEATRELTKLVRSRLGLELPEAADLKKLRSITIRYVLAGEFRSDLQCPAPAALEAIPLPPTKEHDEAIRVLAARLRIEFADAYLAMADRVEAELHLGSAKIPAESLGAIDTFRFEERALLTHCGELISQHRFQDALTVVSARERSFWLDRFVERKAQWEACRRMGELGLVSLSVRAALAALAKTGSEPAKWFEAYTAKDGWYRMDQAQRRLEAWVTSLDDEPAERPLGVVRRVHEETCHAMAEGFTRALARASWTVPGTLPQTRIYSEIVADRPKPVAYFLVDAMRFEMGVELSERLPKSAEVAVRAALGSLPSITPIGMAALQPGASGSFTVVEKAGKLGARIDDTFLPDLPARKKLAAARIPGLVDLGLDELLSLQPSKLAKKIAGAQVVMVRSQEIDHAGEAGFTYQARQVMDTVIDNLARAIRKLAVAGIEHSVVSADHGHVFFATDRDESMRTDSPGGQQIELHRRCWIGRGGTNPPGTIRVAASELGYDSDLDFVFPIGGGVFKAGGDLAFHHGGPSLQEVVLPVVTVRLKTRESARPSAGPVTATGLPDAVTNRIFSVTLKLGGQNLSLFASGMVVRPLLMSGGRQVGTVGMAIGAELDRSTGCVTLQPDVAISVGFLLSDDGVPSLRVVVQDPATDAELFRSPADIPVRLGM
jgi:hypothetical protein